MTAALRSILVCLLVVMGAAQALAADRVALVIGNSAYENVPPLRNPAPDAELVASRLAAAGFDVTHLDNLDQTGMVRALQRFKEKAGTARVALVYYAGHGIEVNRINYFVPVDARLATDSDVQFEAVALDFALSAVARASDLSLVIVDACRNNPFSDRMTRQLGTRSVGRGLSAIEPAGNTLVAYSAKEGTVALDGEGQNSPYALALVKSLEKPGVEIGQMFRQVRDEVLAATNGQQEPFTYGSLSSQEIFLNPAPPTPAPAPAGPSPQGTGAADDVEVPLWTITTRTDTADAYREYLRQYPQGRFAFFAAHRLSELEGSPSAAAAPPPARDAGSDMAADLGRDDIVRAQEALTILGYDPGGRDGVYGGRTEAAVARYQAATNARSTGRLTEAEFRTLIASVSEDQIAALRASQTPKASAPRTAPTTAKSATAKAAPAATAAAGPPSGKTAGSGGSLYKKAPGGYGYIGPSGRLCLQSLSVCENGDF